MNFIFVSKTGFSHSDLIFKEHLFLRFISLYQNYLNIARGFIEKRQRLRGLN